LNLLSDSTPAPHRLVGSMEGSYLMVSGAQVYTLTLNPKLCTLNPKPSTLNPQPSTLNPQPSTLNPQPSTLNPKPQTPYLQP